MASVKAFIIIVIFFTAGVYKSLSTSSNEYCESNQCGDDPNGFDPNLTDEEAVKEYIKKYGVDRLDNFVKARLDGNRNTPLKIAVTGQSGNGKSMLINTFRGLTPDDIGAAQVGSTEATDEIQRYSHPKNKNLKFYDLPGVGTPKWPKESYLERVNYQKYDFFIIVSSKRFTENDLWLSEEVKKYGKGFFFVRTRADEDLVNEKRDHPKTFNESKILEKIRNNCLENIKEVDPTAEVFVISGLLEHTNKFDYGRMEQKLYTSFPSYKRRALIMSMTMVSKEGIKEKVEALRSTVWMISILSGGIGAIPLPGVPFVIDYALITKTISGYKSQLGLDDVSLQRLAKQHDLSLDEIHKILMGGWHGDLLVNNIQNYLVRLLEKYAAEEAVKEFGRHIPVVGWGWAAITTASKTMAILNHSLDQMSQAACSIIDLTK